MIAGPAARVVRSCSRRRIALGVLLGALAVAMSVIGLRLSGTAHEERILVALNQSGGAASFVRIDTPLAPLLDRASRASGVDCWWGSRRVEEVILPVGPSRWQLSTVATLPRLKRLRAPGVVDEHVRLLAPCPQLLELRFGHTALSDLTWPDSVDSRYYEMFYGEVKSRLTDVGVRHLAELRTLRILDLSGSQLTDEGLASLASLEQLEELWLNETAVTDEGLIHLRGMKRLRYLDLGHTDVTGTGLQKLSGLRNLIYVNLSHSRVSDAELTPLLSLPRLRFLNLARTEVTARQETLQMFCAHPTLHLVDLGDKYADRRWPQDRAKMSYGHLTYSDYYWAAREE